MSKRNISYVKPQDPSFLQKLKAQIGYKEGPTVETKRQRFEDDEDFDNDRSAAGDCQDERDDEKPQIVVIKAGDLTAEEAEAEKQRIEKEETEKPADLNQRIIFKKKVKPVDESSVRNTSDKKLKLKKSSEKQTSSKLSFAQDDEEDA